MTQDRPELIDLINSALGHLRTQVAPTIDDPELRSHTLLAATTLERIEARLAETLQQVEIDAASDELFTKMLDDLAAAREQLKSQVLPAIEDPGLRFRTLVAANVLAIAERELALAPELLEAEYARLKTLLGAEGDAQSLEALSDQLLERVSAGQYDEGPERQALFEHLTQSAIEKLQIANPKFLARIEAEQA
jgi:LPS O-antigen subunit length determinant protein (WzzB/FepE family)